MTSSKGRYKKTTTARVGERPALAILSFGAFGAPLGLAALAVSWDTAERALGARAWPSELFAAAALVLWATYTVRYLVQFGQHRRSGVGDLPHLFLCPFAAFLPMIGIILAEHYLGLLTEAAHWLIIAFCVLLAPIGARLMEQWISGGIRISDIHPEFFIPVVAGPFVISLGMNDLGAGSMAMGAFGAGAFFWAIIGAVVAAHSMGSDAPPTDQLPLHAAFLAAPGIACVAWVNLNPGPPVELIGELLTGVLAAMVLMQVMLLNRYAKLSGRG